MKWPIFSRKRKNADSLGNLIKDGQKFRGANGLPHSPKLVRILYTRHDEYSDSDFVAYLVYEILSDNTKYPDTVVHIDRKDSRGNYADIIFNETKRFDTIIIIVLTNDSLSKDNPNFYKELSLCVNLINYNKKQKDMFIPLIVYEGRSRQGRDEVKRSLCSYLNSNQNEGKLSTDDIDNLFLLNCVDIRHPTCDQIIDLQFRELYKDNLRIKFDKLI